MNNKYSFKAIWATTTLAILLLSGLAQADREPSECPISHSHLDHGADLGHEVMDMSKMHMDASPALKLSQSECASCHGLHGMSHADDVPNLAGQNAIYLCQWLASIFCQNFIEDHTSL